MKLIPDYRLMTRLFEVKDQGDEGVNEIIEFIKYMMDSHLSNTFNGDWIRKFERVEVSYILFGGDLDDGRFNDNIVVNVSRDLYTTFQEYSEVELSDYNVTFKEVQDIQKGQLLIRFIVTNKY